MTDSTKRTAKEIYMYYGCSFFHMMREGVYDEYTSHGIREEQESEWRKEFQTDLLGRLANDPCDGHITSKYMSCITRSEQEGLDLLIDMIEEKKSEMDSFSRILCAEAILDFLRNRGIRRDRRQRLRLLGVDLLESAIREPRDIDDRYRKTGYLRDLLSEDRILKRASKALGKMK